MENQTISHPAWLVQLIERLRQRLRDPQFIDRHRSTPKAFTRKRTLTFPIVMLFILQKTVKSVQRHLHSFLDDLASLLDQPLQWATAGAWTQARAKLKATAFSELNQSILLPMVYGPPAAGRWQQWHGHRLMGIDSSLLRLPWSEDLVQAFGLVEVENQLGHTGTRYAQGRLSVLYDVCNRIGLETLLDPHTVAETDQALIHLAATQPGDLLLLDRGFTGYFLLASIRRAGRHFVARCSTGSFAAAQALFALNEAGQSRCVRLKAPSDQHAACRQAGLPLTMEVRFVTVRLSTGELEVLVSSLLAESVYPTQEFGALYHQRWGIETFYGTVKGRLDLENFSGLTAEAIRQDVQAAVFLCNLESLLSQPVHEQLAQKCPAPQHPQQVNRAVSFHDLKAHVLALLYSPLPIPEVIDKLQRLFRDSPVSVRSERKVPRRKLSYYRSYHYQRRVKKIVF